MAIARLNPVLESVRGAVGDVVFKQYGTTLVISRKPVFENRTFSPAQKACQERFRQAALFAQQLMADPSARKVYEEESRVKGKPIRSLMIADFLHARLPEEIASGRQETQPVAVQAEDIGARHDLGEASPLKISTVTFQHSLQKLMRDGLLVDPVPAAVHNTPSPSRDSNIATLTRPELQFRPPSQAQFDRPWSRTLSMQWSVRSVVVGQGRPDPRGGWKYSQA